MDGSGDRGFDFDFVWVLGGIPMTEPRTPKTPSSHAPGSDEPARTAQPHPLEKGSPEYAVMEIVDRIKRQPELQQSWKSMLNAEKNYIIGDFFNIINNCASHSNAPTPASDMLEPDEMFDKLCWADVVLLVMGYKEKDDIRFCSGVSCNYCGKFNDELRQQQHQRGSGEGKAVQ